eukprot:10926970-Alexandrium_andersonii.AAC.1
MTGWRKRTKQHNRTQAQKAPVEKTTVVAGPSPSAAGAQVAWPSSGRAPSWSRRCRCAAST